MVSFLSLRGFPAFFLLQPNLFVMSAARWQRRWAWQLSQCGRTRTFLWFLACFHCPRPMPENARLLPICKGICQFARRLYMWKRVSLGQTSWFRWPSTDGRRSDAMTTVPPALLGTFNTTWTIKDVNPRASVHFVMNLSRTCLTYIDLKMGWSKWEGRSRSFPPAPQCSGDYGASSFCFLCVSLVQNLNIVSWWWPDFW